MRSTRLPAVLVVLALLTAGAFAARWRLDAAGVSTGQDAGTVELDRWLPSIGGASAGGSVWYCVAGTATGTSGGLAEQTVVVTNIGDRPARVRLTAVPSEGSSQSRSFEVPARSRVDTVLSDLVTAPFAAGLVEVTGGQVAVAHVLQGRLGASHGPCASSPATRWYFPAGTTRSLSREVLVAFNPFPDPAVLDIQFAADDGKRTPEAFQGRVVPAGHLGVLEVSDVVTVRESVATDVRVRSGRVVVERLQVFDPESGELARSEGGTKATTGTTANRGGATTTTKLTSTTTSTTARAPSSRITTPDDIDARAYSGGGVSVDLGSPVASPVWVFPGSPGRDSDVRADYVIYNAEEQPADGVLDVTIDGEDGSTDVAPSVEPFTVTVRSEQYAKVSLDNDDRVPVERRHWDFVFTSNGQPVVAERYVRRREGANVPGIDMTIGSPLAATTWVVPAATVAGATSSLATIVNPSSTSAARVTLSVVQGGLLADLAGAVDVEIPAGQSRTFDLNLIDAATPAGVIVRADVPVVVGQELTIAKPLSQSTSLAVPVASTMSRLSPPDLTADVLEGGDTLPGTIFTVPVDDTSVGTDPPGTLPEPTAPAVVGSLPESPTTAVSPTTAAPPP